MRFMIIQKNDPKTEAGEPVDTELMVKVQGFFGELAKDGRFVDGEGLLGSKQRTRLTFRDGAATVKHGPYKGEHELPTSTLLLKVKSRDAAIGWAERYGKILGDGEIELAKMIDPWDVGIMPMPENPDLRFMLIDKADAASESRGRTSKQKADLTRLRTEMTKAGVLDGALHLAASRLGKRLLASGGDVQIFDGPFTESKELIGGYLLLEVANVSAAAEICRQYMALHGALAELDVREVVTEADPTP